MDFLSPLAAVVLVLGLLCGALLLLRNRGAASFRLPRLTASGPRSMEVVERVTLGPQHALHLIRISGRSFVIATSPTTCQLLARMEAQMEAQIKEAGGH